MDEQYLIEEEESSIDFKKIFNDIVKHRMLYAKVLPIAFVLAAIYALAQPNYYNCTVKLSPEMSGSKSTSGLAALASSFGVNLGSGSMVGTEALKSARGDRRSTEGALCALPDQPDGCEEGAISFT